ncbi:ND5 intron 2 (mitochondrion) protein [Rutstroemia sp. NJR-2017a BBW]|nr:ND5 intron 2 (mitochondrion) protein [Rutstroemia sp. NJR-2017a BBW]
MGRYTKVGYQVQLRFRFTQHIRDVELMESLGVKFKDYYDFIKVVELVKNKAHLTSEGFTEADGHFGVKYVESKAKSDTRKRSRFRSIISRCIVYRWCQISYGLF